MFKPGRVCSKNSFNLGRSFPLGLYVPLSLSMTNSYWDGSFDGPPSTAALISFHFHKEKNRGMGDFGVFGVVGDLGDLGEVGDLGDVGDFSDLVLGVADGFI